MLCCAAFRCGVVWYGIMRQGFFLSENTFIVSRDMIGNSDHKTAISELHLSPNIRIYLVVFGAAEGCGVGGIEEGQHEKTSFKKLSGLG